MSVRVLYMDKRGAGCMRTFANERDLGKFVSTLRREAKIELNGKKIGEVYRNSGEYEDRRQKWLWNFERFLDGGEQLRCCNPQGGGGRTCYLPFRHKGSHAFECGKCANDPALASMLTGSGIPEPAMSAVRRPIPCESAPNTSATIVSATGRSRRMLAELS